MGYSSESERPAKRLRPSHPYRQQPTPTSASPTSAAPFLMPPDPVFDTWITPTSPGGLSAAPPSAGYQRTWQPTSFQLPPSRLFPDAQPSEPQGCLKVPMPSDTTASPITEQSLSPTTVYSFHTSPHLREAQSFPVALPTTLSSTESDAVQAIPKNRKKPSNSKTVTTLQVLSPFHDCVGQFGKFARLEFRRPNDGFVNGYVKFRWEKRASPQQETLRQVSDSIEAGLWANLPNTIPGATAGSTPRTLLSPATPDFATTNVIDYSPTQSDWSGFSSVSPPDMLPRDVGGALVQTAKPCLLPPQFGFQGKMETNTDRKFWEFYVNNWCPGRSILRDTNLWLKDFAQMHENEGVRAAIQCLAGVYIYDYVPQPFISKRINELFGMAERRLTTLLNDPKGLKMDQGSELITIAIILSMQDIVLTERRRKKPKLPRWLEGFLQSEYALQLTDPGSRFWKSNNIQLTSLRVSQSIMVGRGVILAQPMMALPSPKDFDPENEASRFGWLLYGTEEEMYAIHGGCGFSRKLLHIIGQVTYCAARLQQDGGSPVAPMTAQFLLKVLQEMRQWSNETVSWGRAKTNPPTIEWVRNQAEDYEINTSKAMTAVTAEAWRFAAMVYLQCRALRLPRDHPQVLANMMNLASCIHIMPTSGTHFTAQAPLFPVFLLGMAATDPLHKQISRQWFEQVVYTPVRSSVPALFETLQRIWSWVDNDIPLENQTPPESIALRDPWWERLIERVEREEEETICLT